jgi:hypothetical protein
MFLLLSNSSQIELQSLGDNHASSLHQLHTLPKIKGVLDSLVHSFQTMPETYIKKISDNISGGS